jgi:hypothetical protein
LETWKYVKQILNHLHSFHPRQCHFFCIHNLWGYGKSEQLTNHTLSVIICWIS